MNQPPPHGWQQQAPQQGWQQQPPPPGPGYPQQGHGYQQPGYPKPPEKKGKGPIIALVVVLGVVLLGGLSTGGFFFYNAHRDRGLPPSGATMPEQCGAVSPETLAKARTTNPHGQLSSAPDDNTVNCSWQQTLGKDGAGQRLLYVRIWKGDGKEKFDSMVHTETAGSGITSVTDVSGVGEEGKAVVEDRKSESFATYTLISRKGDAAVSVSYTASDPGLFSQTKPDMDEVAQTARTIMDEVLGKL